MPSDEERLRNIVQRAEPAMSMEAARSEVEHRVRRRHMKTRLGAIGIGVSVSALVLAVALPALNGLNGEVEGGASGSMPISVLTSSPNGLNLYNLDPVNGEVRLLRTFDPSGAQNVVNPDLALSPSGSTAFVAWEDSSGQRLDVIDLPTGKLMTSVPLSDLPPTQLPADFIATDEMGNAFIYEIYVGKDGSVAESVASFDSGAGLLPQTVSMDACGGEDSLEAIGPNSFAVVCSISGDVRIVRVGDDGSASALSRVALPVEPPPDDSTVLPDQAIRGVVFDPATSTLSIVTEGGRVLRVDTTTASLRSEMRLALPPGGYVVQGGAVLSTDGSMMYLEVGDRSAYDPLRGTQVLGYATTDGRMVVQRDLGQIRPQLAMAGTEVVVQTVDVDGLVSLDQANGLREIASVRLPPGDVILDVEPT
jgi:hypothetical protein